MTKVTLEDLLSLAVRADRAGQAGLARRLYYLAGLTINVGDLPEGRVVWRYGDILRFDNPKPSRLVDEGRKLAAKLILVEW